MFNRIWTKNQAKSFPVQTQRLYFLLLKWEKESVTWSVLFSSVCLKVNRNKSWGFITSTELRSGSGYIIFKCSTLITWPQAHWRLQEVLLHIFISKVTVLLWLNFIASFQVLFCLFLFLFLLLTEVCFLVEKKKKNEITLEISFKAGSILERPLQSLDRIYLFSSSPFFSHFTLSLSVTS